MTDVVTFAKAKVIDDATNSGTNTYNISDNATNIVAGISSSTNAVNGAGTVTVTGTASVTQANTLGGISKAIVYSLSDTGVNLAAGTAAALNEAVDITASDSVTYAQGKIIKDATNSGDMSYSISDTAANIAAGITADEAVFTSTGVGTVAATTLAVVATAAPHCGCLSAGCHTLLTQR